MAQTNPSPAFDATLRELASCLRGVPDNTPPRQRKRPTRELAPLIEDLLVKYHVGRHSPLDIIRENWAAVVEPAIAAYSHPVQIDPQGRLIILYNQPVVGNELRFNQDKILARIQVLPGCDEIKNLTIRAG